MSNHPLTTDPPDICLILRAHAEQQWLMSEVLPTVHQLEQLAVVPEEQIGAALAYLEVLWLDACRRARDTDTAHAQLRDLEDAASDGVLYEKARRYHAAVHRLRVAVRERVCALTGASQPEPAAQHEHAEP